MARVKMLDSVSYYVTVLLIGNYYVTVLLIGSSYSVNHDVITLLIGSFPLCCNCMF